MKQVVITGVGAVSPIGGSLDDALAAFLAARSVVRLAPPPEEFAAWSRPRAQATITEDVAEGVPTALVKTADRTTLLALRASDRALADAGLAPGGFESERFGTYVGCGSGPLDSHYIGNETLLRKDSISAMTVLRVLPNAPAAQVSMRHQLRGECITTCVGGASASVALGTALRAIRRGELDGAVAGGVESPLGVLSQLGWERLGLLARVDPQDPAAACRPFSRDRTGVVLGEGAVLFVLESADHARARGARVLATLGGYGFCNDAGASLVRQEALGQATAMRAALRDAGLQADDIHYVAADAPGTRLGDAIEAQALHATFGARAAQGLPVSSTKGLHGHLLGAAPGMGLLGALVALRDGVLPPTVNHEANDPGVSLDVVPNAARRGVRVDAALVNGFALGGASSSLVVTR